MSESYAGKAAEAAARAKRNRIQRGLLEPDKTLKKKGKTLVEVFSEECEKPGTAAWFDMVNERYGDLLKMDGFDSCIIGLSHQFNKTTILYDKKKVIEKLTQEYAKPELRYGIGAQERKEVMDEAEEMACDWYSFNMIGAWMGDTTPSFFTKS